MRWLNFRWRYYDFNLPQKKLYSQYLLSPLKIKKTQQNISGICAAAVPFASLNFNLDGTSWKCQWMRWILIHTEKNKSLPNDVETCWNTLGKRQALSRDLIELRISNYMSIYLDVFRRNHLENWPFNWNICAKTFCEIGHSWNFIESSSLLCNTQCKPNSFHLARQKYADQSMAIIYQSIAVNTFIGIIKLDYCRLPNYYLHTLLKTML